MLQLQPLLLPLLLWRLQRRLQRWRRWRLLLLPLPPPSPSSPPLRRRQRGLQWKCLHFLLELWKVTFSSENDVTTSVTDHLAGSTRWPHADVDRDPGCSSTPSWRQSWHKHAAWRGGAGWNSSTLAQWILPIPKQSVQWVLTDHGYRNHDSGILYYLWPDKLHLV